MRHYLTLLVVPFVLSAVLAAQPPKGGGGKPVDPPGKGQPPTTGPGNKPEEPGKSPGTPPGAAKAGEAPNSKAKEPVVVPVTITPTTTTGPEPVKTVPAPQDNPNPVKPGDCPVGQTCEPLVTPPGAVPYDPTKPAGWAPPMPAVPAQASQYAQRYALSADTWFVGRVTLAATTVVNEILMEPEATADHATRLRFVGVVMRNPDESGRRLARLVAISVPIATNSQGQVTTSVTDAQLILYLRQRWTALAKSMGQLF
jgi:hypothetical protein